MRKTETAVKPMFTGFGKRFATGIRMAIARTANPTLKRGNNHDDAMVAVSGFISIN